MTDQAYETPGVLDLSGADTSGFDALPANRYNGQVWECEWQATKADSEGKLGPNVPFLNVQFKINDEPFENRRVFAKFFPVVPAGYDEGKGKKLKGGFVNFLVALGYTEAEVTSGSFALDLEQLKGKELVLAVTKREYPKDSGMFVNDVAGVKPAGAPTSSSPTGLL